MSQITKTLTSGGPIPPIIPTKFTADDATVGVPVMNNFNLFSRETTDDNNQGIQTTTDINGSANHYTELTNRITGLVSTTDATPTALITFPLGASPKTYIGTGMLCAFSSTGPSGASWFFNCAFRTDGANAFELGIEVKNVFKEAALTNADISVAASGNNLVVTVTGINATNITWDCLINFRTAG